MDAENTNEIQTSTNEETTKKGYGFLRELCSFGADFHAFTPQANPLTNRVQYIIHQLTTYNIPHEVDMFRADGRLNEPMGDNDAKFVNVYVFIRGLDETKTTVFSAHHDVANRDSENCQDNTASVCNLLDLALRLSKQQPVNNVLIAFTDAEEIVQPAKSGANRVALKIQAGNFAEVKYIYNLELTANGTRYWYSYQNQPNVPVNEAANHLRQLHPSAARVRTPYNDSYAFEMRMLPSVCIGSLTETEMLSAKQGVGCKTWMLCHSMNDTFGGAVEADMDAFVDFLVSLI